MTSANKAMNQEIVAPLLAWYAQNKRDLPWRQNKDPYRIWVSEIMLQQTRVEAVRAYFMRFTQAFPTVEALAAAPQAQYVKLWEGLGYYRRVHNLHQAACQICAQGSFPQTVEQLSKLPGIGAYTAGAIASIAFDQRVPAVDGNVLRVLTRLTADTRLITSPAVKKDITAAVAAILPEDAGSFNQALMELGALVCIPHGAPHCTECPLQPYCQGQAIAASLPRKAAKKPRTILARTVFLLRLNDKLVLHRRAATGLLAGLWELPAAEQTLTPAEARRYLQSQGFILQKMLRLRPAKHIFTHIEWHMTGYYAELSSAAIAEGLIFATRQQMQEEYTLPSAFASFLAVLDEELL